MSRLNQRLSRDTNSFYEFLWDESCRIASERKIGEKQTTEDFVGPGKIKWEDVEDDVRTELWLSILNRGGRHYQAALNFYSLLEQEVPDTVVQAIERDLGRTFPNSDLFTIGNGQRSMKSILQAYAAYDHEIGYCQGMNFLVGLLLFYLPREEDAFGALVFLMHERGLRDLYTTEMPLLELRLWQLSQLLPQSLLSHLESFAILPVLFAPSWFLTCFAASFPVQIAAKILDIILCDNYECFMLRFACTILTSSLECILALNDVEEILDFLRVTIPNRPICELSNLVDKALATSWSIEHQVIIKDRNITESVYDSVLRVEDGVSFETKTFDQEECNVGKRNHCLKRSLPKITRFLSRLVIINLKQLRYLYKASRLQQIFKKL